MKEDKITRILNCSYKEFLSIYKDEAGQNDYHLKRGDINIKFTNWTTITNNGTSSSGIGNNQQQSYDIIEERSISFQAPINAPQSVLKIIGKSATTINEQQKISVNSSAKSIDIATFYKPDIMGEYFNVATEWYLKTIDTEKCSLELVIRVNFNIKFVSNLFEVFIIKAASDSAVQYVDIVEDYLEKLNIEKRKQFQLQQQQQQQQQQLQQQILLKQQQQLQQQQQQQQIQNLQYQHQSQHSIKKTNKNKSNSNNINNNSNDNYQSQYINNNNNNHNNKIIKPLIEPYQNWSVDCNIDQIKKDLNRDLDSLKSNSLDASQGLLKVEISLSEMKSEELNNQSNVNNQQLSHSISNSSLLNSSSSTNDSSNSSTSFLSPYNLGLLDKNKQLYQNNHHSQQQQLSLQTQHLNIQQQLYLFQQQQQQQISQQNFQQQQLQQQYLQQNIQILPPHLQIQYLQHHQQIIQQLQQQQQQQQHQQQQQQQQQQNHFNLQNQNQNQQYHYQQLQQHQQNLPTLIKQIEYNNKVLKDQRLESENRIEEEIQSISDYFDDMVKLQEDSKPWFPSIINISFVVVALAVILSIFSNYQRKRK